LLLVGLGTQGQAALYDLVGCGAFAHVVVADNRAELAALTGQYPADKVSGVRLDANDEAGLMRLMRDADVVVEALPATMVLRTGQLAVECGVPLVSSMFYFNPEGLDAAGVAAQRAALADLDLQAKAKGITILSEFGMDPGLDLLMAAKAISEFDEVHEFNTYGAGLPAPESRDNPLQYKFSWSPIGVMRAYHRPSAVIRDGESVTIPAREIFEARHCHTIDVAEIGPLECFANGDAVHYAELLGIRSTLRESGRYTGRYPGHCAFWDVAVKSGFVDDAPIRVRDVTISPIQFTAALLTGQRQFQIGDGERDLSFIRVDARGLRGGKQAGVSYELIDYRDLKNGFTAMQRTVGFTLSRGAQLIASGKLSRPGLLTPLDVPYEDVIPALEQHGIHVTRRAEV
jgi:lysine 6-dehydrogenase